jgi:ferredoxin-nitrite reductase
MWVSVGKAADLVPDRACVVRAGGLDLALACTSDGVFAMDNTCPHSGGPLGEGVVQGGTLTCPLHGWQFEVRSGRCLTEKRPAQRLYPVKVEAAEVWVEVPDRDASTAVPAPQVAGETASVQPPGIAPQPPAEPAARRSPVEVWKQAKHGFDVWPDLLRHAAQGTSMSRIEEADLERFKWYGFFYRKNNDVDHYMCRIRIPGCEMTAEQARAVAYLAHQSGYSIVDLTTRGNLQVQGLRVESLPAAYAALERVGLTSRQSGHDNVRNVTSHPWSGIDPEELIDTRDLARQIQARVIGNREFADLPRKLNVALSGRSDPAAHAWTQDLCFVAAYGPGGAVGFQLLLGGNQGQSPKLATHVPVFVRTGQVTEVTAAVVRAFRELGQRHNRHQVRLRYLLERIGPDGLLLEVEKRLGYELERFPRPVARPSREERFTGWFRQKQDNLWAMGVAVPLGRLTADQLDGLAALARRFGDGTLRTTYDQNLVLPGIPTGAKDEAGHALAAQGLTFEPDAAVRSTVACTGKQFCNIAVTETKGYAYQLIEELRRRNVQLHGVHVHLSGCPSSCAMSYTADIGLKGVKVRRGLRVLDAFDVYLGGGLADEVRMGVLYQKGVPFGELPGAIEGLVREFHLQRRAGETFSGFWQRRLMGHQAEPLKMELPRWRCTRCGHRHVAQDPPPFCPVCAAIRSRFEPAADDDELAAKPPAAPAPAKAANKRILIVGGGIAGHTAAQAAREADPQARITLVTDEAHSFYSRLNLTRFLAQEIEREALFEYAADWYRERGIDLLTQTRVIGLDPPHKTALLAEGRELEYDACVLAHGSAAATPPFHRELPGVFLLRTLTDVEGMLGALQPERRVAVIGGGVLGIEAALGARRRGASAAVFELQDRLMPRQLDAAASALLQEHLAAKGIETVTGAAVAELLGAERATGLAFADGRRCDTDLVIVTTGIRPNIDWVSRSGIRCARGVLVDDRMLTSAPDVYAAGDVAEWRGEVVGLWTPAVEQARVAGSNAAGRHAVYQGCLPVTTLKCLGTDLVSIGELPEDGGPITSRTTRDGGVYRRIVFRHGVPAGAVLLGAASGMGELLRLIESGRELERLRRRVVPDEAMAGA